VAVPARVVALPLHVLVQALLGDLLDRTESPVPGKGGAAAQDSGENQCNDMHSDGLPPTRSFPATILCNISIPMGRSGFPVSSTGYATWRIGQQDHFIIKQLHNHQWVAGESERTYLKNILHLEQNILRSSMVFQTSPSNIISLGISTLSRTTRASPTPPEQTN
jgi:hypothetical protein